MNHITDAHINNYGSNPMQAWKKGEKRGNLGGVELKFMCEKYPICV